MRWATIKEALSRLLAVLAALAVVLVVMAAVALISEYRQRPRGMGEVIDPNEDTYFSELIAGAVKMSTDSRAQLQAQGRDPKLAGKFTGDRNTYRRDVHAKSHGCVKATFNVLPVADNLRYGLFREPGEYRAWIRFSNGKTLAQPDSARDARGMAIKVMGVDGEKLLDGEQWAGTQDFIMINSKVFFVQTIQQYAAFARGLSEGNDVGYFLGGPSLDPRTWKLRQMYLALKTLKAPPASLLNTQYHSLSAYHLGEAAFAKYSARPCAPRKDPRPDKSDPDFLRNTMNEELKQGGACFELLVQLQVPGKNMPVEDTTVEWDEDESPFIPVARVEILPKQDLSDPKMLEFCENLSFNPWHSLKDHKPAGIMNRARKALYLQDSRFRRCKNGVAFAEPAPEKDGIAWPMELDGVPCTTSPSLTTPPVAPGSVASQ